MTASNDFRPFATGSGALVTSQPNWAARAAVATGFQTGILLPQDFNKLVRQSSVPSWALTALIANYQGDPVLDNGDTATLYQQLIAALSGLIQQVGGGSGSPTAYTGTEGVKVAATQILLNYLGLTGKTPADTDYLAFYSQSDTHHRRMTMLQLANYINSTTAGINATEGVKYLSGILSSDFPGLSAANAIANSDLIEMYDISVSKHVKITLGDLGTYINPPPAADYLSFRSFGSAGTFSFTPDANCAAIEIQAWGGSGGGAYSSGNAAGGGGGGYASGAYPVTGAAISVIVGAAGAGGTSGATSGSDGGDTSVGSFCTARGGGGAAGNTPGAGGVATGQVVFTGQRGAQGVSPGGGNYFPGGGGGTFGFSNNLTNGPVMDGAFPGVGGTGGNSSGAAGSGGPNGGNGHAGLVVIKQIARR